VSVTDVCTDPVTLEFRETYFLPLGVSSMLDAPIYADGKVLGIVCHEHVGPEREWSRREMEFAASVAEVISRLREESIRHRAETDLGLLQGKLTSLEKLSAMGQLAAGIAHDFRNVIAVAGGYAELIRKAALAPSLPSQWIDGLDSALEQGLRLTRELTALPQSRPVKPGVVDIGELLIRYRDMLSMAASPGATLKLSGGPGVGNVFVDPSELERAVLNLVLNARDAMPQGGEIGLHCARTSRTVAGKAKGEFLVLTVSDTGRGMDAETQENMFEPYFTTKGEKGTGLGLAIVHQVVSQAGGLLEVDSSPGQGTRISILLPKIS
jgi:signal transduction histidine kinase